MSLSWCGRCLLRVTVLLVCLVVAVEAQMEAIITPGPPGGGGGTPGGTTTQFQFNDAGAFGGTTGLLYSDPTTLATSGWKFGANGLSGNFLNPTTGNDVNFRRALDVFVRTDLSMLNPVFATDVALSITRESTGMGQNDKAGPSQAKASFGTLFLSANDAVSGQHFGIMNAMRVRGMGDVFGMDNTIQVWGGINADGDEGQGVLRLVVDQPSPAGTGTISALPTQSTCNTTLTQAITKSPDLQTVTVASTTGCAVNDRVVIDQSDPFGTQPRMELVVLTGVGVGTITARFRHNHVSGDTVVAAMQMTITAGNLGVGRYVINLSGPSYSTGTVTEIANAIFTGTGTTWTTGMVGGTAKLPGCISLQADDVTTSPFSVGAPLRGWFGIRVDSTTSLAVAQKQDASSRYKGNGPGSGVYVIRPCARVLEAPAQGSTIWVEPNSFTWAVGQNIEHPHSSSLFVPGLIRAQTHIYSPNAIVTSIYSAANFGTAMNDSAYHAGPLLVGVNSYSSVFTASTNAAQAFIRIAGVSATGELIRTFTDPGDNKYITWQSDTGAGQIGLDDATNKLLLTASAGVLASGPLQAASLLTNTFSLATLGTPANGTLQYCNDCTKTTPCAGGGTGAIAKRINNAWDCD